MSKSIRSKFGVRMLLVFGAMLSTLMLVGCVVNEEDDMDSSYTYTGRIVTIGSQTWMAENLDRATSNSKCYDNKDDYCAQYGRLYSWDAAKTACPAGWHLPSDAEWGTLVNYAGGESVAGQKLKSLNGWRNAGNGTDDYGFSALPGGWCQISSVHVGNRGFWWSSTETGKSEAWWRSLFFGDGKVGMESLPKTYMASVRCVQN